MGMPRRLHGATSDAENAARPPARERAPNSRDRSTRTAHVPIHATSLNQMALAIHSIYFFNAIGQNKMVCRSLNTHNIISSTIGPTKVRTKFGCL